MLVLSEADAKNLLSMPDAIDSMRGAFAAFHRGAATAFPLVRERINQKSAVFGIKSGAETDTGFLGLKAGGYWANNAKKNLTNHQSCTILFDADTGQPSVFLSANYLTAMRTAAVAGLATDYLAKANASVMGIVGAGLQAIFQIEAVNTVRPISKLLISSRTMQSAEALVSRAKALGIEDVRVATTEEATRNADVLTTVTPASKPLIENQWLQPDTHINAMGSDTAGKRELDGASLKSARVYVDSWAQAASVGECQHGVAEWGMQEVELAGTLGELVLAGVSSQREQTGVSVFDSTGLAVQDLCLAQAVVNAAIDRNMGQRVHLDGADNG